MTIAAVGSLTSARVTSGTTQTFTLAPTNATDVIVMGLNWQASGTNVSSIATASNGIIWEPWVRGKLTNSNLGSSVSFMCYIGRVQSTTSRLTTITYSAAVTSARYDFQEFSTTNPNPVWVETFHSSGGATTGTALAGTALATSAGMLGWQGFVVANTGSNTVTGTGWVAETPQDSATNVFAHNVNCPNGNTAPSTSQSPTGGWINFGIALSDILWVPPGVNLQAA